MVGIETLRCASWGGTFRWATTARVFTLRALLIVIFGFINTAKAEPDAVLIEFWDDYEASSIMQVNHAPWQDLLNKYLNDRHPSGINRFNYSSVTEVDRVRLDDYLNYLQLLEPRQFNVAEQKAYWLNLYNAKTLSLALNGFIDDEITSIRQVRSGVFTPGPWTRKTLRVAQQELSLDDIYHGVLRPLYKDRRIHFGVNQAALGSPNLLKEAFTAANTEELLIKAEQDFLSHSRAVRIVEDDLVLSQLFDWYGTDFASNADELIAYLLPFVSPEVGAGIQARDKTRFDFDWDLNKQGPVDR